MGEVLVTPNVYDRIQSADRPVFSHVVGAEIGRYIAVDAETQQAGGQSIVERGRGLLIPSHGPSGELLECRGHSPSNS
jgi:hypothetical protein